MLDAGLSFRDVFIAEEAPASLKKQESIELLHIKRLTFALSCARRHAAQARCVTMVELAHTGLGPHAVACQLERWVRRRFAPVAGGRLSDSLPVTYLCKTLAISV